MSRDRPRHHRSWPGECPRGGHKCARPPGHDAVPELSVCMCYCGERAPKLEPRAPGEPVGAGQQETLL